MKEGTRIRLKHDIAPQDTGMGFIQKGSLGYINSTLLFDNRHAVCIDRKYLLLYREDFEIVESKFKTFLNHFKIKSFLTEENILKVIALSLSLAFVTVGILIWATTYFENLELTQKVIQIECAFVSFAVALLGYAIYVVAGLTFKIKRKPKEIDIFGDIQRIQNKTQSKFSKRWRKIKPYIIGFFVKSFLKLKEAFYIAIALKLINHFIN